MVRPKTRTLWIALVTAIVAASLVPLAQAQARTVGTARSSDAWISAEANRLSGRKLAVVCAASEREWSQTVADARLPGPAGEYYGFSLIQSGAMYLSPYVCEGLRLGSVAGTRRTHEMQVAWSANVLIHESGHLGRFSTDESLVEACARIGLPAELNRLYGVQFRSAEMRRLTSASDWLRRTMPAEYQSGTCSPPPA